MSAVATWIEPKKWISVVGELTFQKMPLRLACASGVCALSGQMARAAPMSATADRTRNRRVVLKMGIQQHTRTATLHLTRPPPGPRGRLWRHDEATLRTYRFGTHARR